MARRFIEHTELDETRRQTVRGSARRACQLLYVADRDDRSVEERFADLVAVTRRPVKLLRDCGAMLLAQLQNSSHGVRVLPLPPR